MKPGEVVVNPPEIDSYEFGVMVVDGQVHRNDLVILPERVLPNWWRGEGHRLDARDLADVLAARPQVLVVGTGSPGMMRVPEDTRQAVAAAGIEMRVAPSTEAWVLYNESRSQLRTAAAFHLTC